MHDKFLRKRSENKWLLDCVPQLFGYSCANNIIHFFNSFYGCAWNLSCAHLAVVLYLIGLSFFQFISFFFVLLFLLALECTSSNLFMTRYVHLVAIYVLRFAFFFLKDAEKWFHHGSRRAVDTMFFVLWHYIIQVHCCESKLRGLVWTLSRLGGSYQQMPTRTERKMWSRRCLLLFFSFIFFAFVIR